MEDILGVILFWGILIGAIVFASVRGRNDTSEDLRQHARKSIEKGLTITVQDDVFEPASGVSLPIKRVVLSGSLIVPTAPQEVSLQVRLLDLTSGGDPYPIFCQMDDYCDDNGLFHYTQTTRIPYQLSRFEGLVIGAIPIFALVGPAKGTRAARLTLLVTDARDPDRVFSHGDVDFKYQQESLGYIELQQQTRARERQIASLALAISAADGNVDARESRVIRRFFAERYAHVQAGEELRKRVTDALQDTLRLLKDGHESPRSLIDRLCQELRQDGDTSVAQTAYELCVEVVAADEAVDKREQEALDAIAKQLQLPAQFVREVHDRNLRLSMYEESEDEDLIGMPSGLSPQERIQYLNAEYRKWRARATHKDPEVAAEAALRLERIAKLRRQMGDV